MGDIGIVDVGSCHDDHENKAVISSKAVVEELYSALGRGDAGTARRLLNPEVDWRFHGPRAQQHLALMRLLAGHEGAAWPGVPFEVGAVDAFGPTVLAEGTDAAGALYWVHAWTVGPGGRVTEVREYCNTAVVVVAVARGLGDEATAAVYSPSRHVWRSRLLPDRARRNMPAIVLVI